MKKTLIVILMTFLFIVFPFSGANAALLNVTIKPDSVQIDSAGSTGLTVMVKTGTGLPVGGAALTFAATPAACAAPTTATPTTNASGMNSSPITFAGPATTSVVVCKISITATSGPDSGTATVSIIVGKGYVPLVPIPGVGTPTSFPAYLVGLYKLALISIAIFAMMMILYGGFKYMTSAGNPALMGDAKDAIWSAIFGLILALLSWLILNTVNPELTMVKTPGTSISLFTPSTSTAKTFFAVEGELTSPTCNCTDGSVLSNPSGNSCNFLCSENLIADFRMGMSQMDGNSLATDKERAQKYATKFGYTWDTAIDYSMCADGHFDINAADFTSKFSDVTSMKVDVINPFNGDCADATNLDLLLEPNPGYFGPPALAMSCPIGAISTNYAAWEADPNCRPVNTPTAVICPVKLCITWTIGGVSTSKSRVQYLKFIKP